MKITTEINMQRELAKFIHDTYEKIAKKKGWKTQKKSRVSFDKLPKKNRETMLEITKAIGKWFENNGVNGHDDFYNYICIKKELFEELKQN